MASFDVVAIDPSISIRLEDKEATCACFSEDGCWLAVSYDVGMLEVYKVKDGSLCYSLNPNSATKYPNVSVCFRPSGELFSTKNVLISCDVGGKVYHWHVTSGKLMNTIDEPGNEVFTVAHQEEGVLFATAGLDAKVRIYDGLTMKLCNVLEEGNGTTTVGHTNRIFALKWNPSDPNTVLSGGWDSTVQIWDLRVGKSVRSIFGPYLCGASLDFDDSSSRVLTGSWREFDKLQEWDYGSGSLIRAYEWPQTMNKECHIYSACYGRNVSQNFLAAAGSASNEASIFHTESGQLVGGMYELQKGVVCVSFDPAGKHMCIVSSNQLFIVHMKKYLHSFRSMIKI